MKIKILLLNLAVCIAYGTVWAQTSFGGIEAVGTTAGIAGDNTNSYFGHQAGLNNSAANNTFLGTYSGFANTMGSYNTFVGRSSGASNINGNSNTFVGYFSGLFKTSGNYNTFLGTRSGYNNQTGSANVFLGYNAGYNELGSDRLYIDNSSTSTPLIFGNFSTNRIGINENNPAYTLDVGGNMGATTFYGSGAGLTSLNASNLSMGTVNNSRLDADLQDLADGALSASRVQYGSYFITTAGSSGQMWRSDGSGQGAWSTNGSSLTSLNASNLSTGTVNNSRLDADLQDLADGTLSASRVQYGSYFITTTGSSGQVWQSDGIGQGVWVDLNSTFATDAELSAANALKANITYVDAADNLKANLASPTFTGTPILPTGTIATTQTAGNSSTALATTEFVTTADDLKANLVSPTFTGTPILPTGTIATTQTAGNSSTALATTEFVTTVDDLKANLVSPSFTGTVSVQDIQMGSSNSLYFGANEFLHSRSKSTALGKNALSDVTASGKFNTAIGTAALQDNTSGDNNIAIGDKSLTANKGGNNNTALGFQALDANLGNVGGSGNVAVGRAALTNNTEGSDNVAVGRDALQNNTTGNSNVAVGHNTGPTTDNLNNTVAIGNGATVTGDNAIAIGDGAVAGLDEVRLGNISTVSIGGFQPWSNLSDGRFKQDLKEDIPGLAFITRLRPVSYTLDHPKLSTFLGKEQITAAKSQEANSQRRSIGFVAQEVAQVLEDNNYTTIGIEKPRNEQEHYSIRYAEFVVPLVKGMQQQQQIIETLQERIEILESLIANTDNVSPINDESTQAKSNDLDGFALYQNVPNPFDKTTTIEAVVPENIQQARIIVYNLQGLELEYYDINKRGTVSVEISAGRFPSGMYLYALLADGQVIDTKKMILTR